MAQPLPLRLVMKNKAVALRTPESWSSSRDEVIERSLPLVRSIAARLRLAHGLSMPFEDLFALGVTGLLQAAERFDPSRGVAFVTFAYYRIRGAILDSLRRDPDLHHIYAAQMPVAIAGHEVPYGEIAANDNGRFDLAAEAPVGQLTWTLSDPAVHLMSLDALGAIADESAPHPDEEVERRWQAERIGTALAALPDIERQVIQLYYYEDLSFSEIGARLGICKPWAFRLHNKAVNRLRETLAELAESVAPEPTA
jgi:RNA polymerase sigma factor for flagellar operon FliA